MIKNVDNKSNLVDLLLMFRRNIREIMKEEGLQYDLTFSQAEVLRFVGLSGKETMKNIAHYLRISPPSATEIITEMEKRGLVKRQSDKSDRRIIFICLTRTSQKLFNSVAKQKNLIFQRFISKLNKKDKKTLERIIRILLAE